ncbi:MAG: hypothetical protein IPJ82_21050 [Lewinellaceae bacterium]|nr:hypothetical protein [Lewinellaceae bacterium]
MGFTRATLDGKTLVQDFLPAAEYNYTELSDLPAAPEFFLTHPTMDQELLSEQSYGSFYNEKYHRKGYTYDNQEPIMNKEYEHFVPLEFPGNGRDTPSQSNGHVFPLQDYYRFFFDSRIKHSGTNTWTR